ncbi:TonB-dependent receptor [Echinicola jeungdonensis]|uniref:TonB-dependent receptor n=2 Tax=Echinicola jeungdonensis TaxID=709343 RepID=A0ABV5J6M3_9BACT|nr:TonB-dependent receptor [Echinicola jeungdonensis]MDN3669261.1 TonB-dependent receptor [Echinicola jeungdonensis]
MWLCPLIAIGQAQLLILDAETKVPIPEVEIQISRGESYISNQEGKVQLEIQNKSQASLTHFGYWEKVVQLIPDQVNTIELKSKANNLAEVIVSGFESERPLLEQAASVSKVSEANFHRFNEISPVHAFNTKPGVRFEERAPSSYRISIRGSSLRAPFGVRNVKVYWNGIPFTAPDGTTPLNILDLSNMEEAEIIKGPAGSIYGAGNGGVISLTSQQDIAENKLETDLSIGDFGMVKYRLGLDQQLENGNISTSYVRQKSDGYRDHSAMDRKVLQVTGNFFPSAQQTISTQWLYADLNYEIPGGLNADQLEENRQQARPGSAEQNASILQKSLYGMIMHDYTFSESLTNQSTFYLNATDFENPFNLDYKKETQYGYGGRTKFVWNDHWADFPVRVIAGGEYQFSNTSAQNYGNRGGKADTIRFGDDLITTQGFLFQQLEVDWTSQWRMTVGMSENFSKFDINRNIDASTGVPYAAKRKFDPVLVPRVALLGKLNDYSALHASISAGFSPPTIDEVRTNEGTINLDLEAERGTNYEIGYRSHFGQDRVNFNITTFYFQLDETITTYTNEQGVVLFRNAGATDQKGMEMELDYWLQHCEMAWLQEVHLTHAYTGHFFKFKDYAQDGEDYSGNDLTGVAPHTLINQLDLKSRPGLYFNFTHQFVDKIPLNDNNTVYQDAYHLLNLRMGWRKQWNAQWNLEVYSGIENLGNESYSLGNDLNAFGGRYFQPAPKRNYYGGLKVTYQY